TVGLDPTQIRETRKLVRELGGDHTVMLSTHILPEVEAVCDRAIVIASGKIVAQGTPDELRSSRRTSARVLVECRGPQRPVRDRGAAAEGRVQRPGGSGADRHSARVAAAGDSAGECDVGRVL